MNQLYNKLRKPARQNAHIFLIFFEISHELKENLRNLENYSGKLEKYAL